MGNSSRCNAEGIDVKRIAVANIEIDLLTRFKLNEIVRSALSRKRNIIIGNHNLHSVYIYQTNDRFREFYKKCDFIHIDGMGINILALFYGIKIKSEFRTTYADWFRDLLSIADQNNLKLYCIGHTSETMENAREKMDNEFPNLSFSGHHGYFELNDLEATNKILDEINKFKPNFLFLGMGMIKQEEFLLRFVDNIQCDVIFQSGACLEYYVGKSKTPPRWSGRLGLEWVYRLLGDPKRLWKRYILEPILLLGYLVKLELFNKEMK